MFTNLRMGSIAFSVIILMTQGSAAAQRTDSQAAPILEALDSGLDSFTAKLENKSIRWPKLRSVSNLNAEPQDRAASWQDRIASALFRRLQAFEEERSLDSSLDQRRWAIYIGLAKALRESGGFFNYVLADTVHRVALSRLGYRLASFPADCRDADPYLAQLAVKRWEPDDILSFARDSLGEDFHQAPEALGERLTFSRVFERLGANLEEIGSNAMSTKLATSELRTPVTSTVRLTIVRILETQLLATSVLPGYCVFINVGGDSARVTRKDVSHFTAVMGNRRARFGFEPFGFVALRASDVINFVEQFRNPDRTRAYRNIALR